MSFAAQFALVFVLSVAVDFFWTKYTIAVASRQAMRAACWSAAIAGFGAISVISYIEDKRLLPAAVVGYFVGTLIAVKREKSPE